MSIAQINFLDSFFCLAQNILFHKKEMSGEMKLEISDKYELPYTICAEKYQQFAIVFEGCERFRNSLER